MVYLYPLRNYKSKLLCLIPTIVPVTAFNGPEPPHPPLKL